MAERWQPWPIAERLGGGYCVVLGEPDAKLQIGRQIGGVPPLSHDDAAAIAKAMNRKALRDAMRGQLAELTLPTEVSHGD